MFLKRTAKKSVKNLSNSGKSWILMRDVAFCCGKKSLLVYVGLYNHILVTLEFTGLRFGRSLEVKLMYKY